MNKEEFLRGLQSALSGEVPPGTVQENLRFYDDYIRAEMQKGRTEAEVMEELGDPRLIARTIIDTTPGAGDGAYESYSSGGGESYRDGSYRQESTERQSGNVHYYDLSKWYWKLLGIVLVIAVVGIVVTVVSGLLSLVIPILPVIGLVLVIMWFVRGGPRQ